MIIAHSMSSLHFLYKSKGVMGLFKTVFVRMHDVKRIAKWSVFDRSNVQCDTDALDVRRY